MTTLSEPSAATPVTSTTDRGVRLTSLAGGLAAGGAGLAMLFANPATGDTGQEVAQSLGDASTLLTGLTILAVYGAAALFVAAAHLSRRLGGVVGAVVMAAGVGVALLSAAYLVTFGAGATVTSLILEDAGAGLGEATLVTANLIDLVRYAPSLALVAAVFVARQQLPKAVGITAAILAVLVVFPLTSWAAALLVPLWLGVVAATVPARD